MSGKIFHNDECAVDHQTLTWKQGINAGELVKICFSCYSRVAVKRPMDFSDANSKKDENLKKKVDELKTKMEIGKKRMAREEKIMQLVEAGGTVLPGNEDFIVQYRIDYELKKEQFKTLLNLAEVMIEVADKKDANA